MRLFCCLLGVLLFPIATMAAFDRPSENDRLGALGNLFEEPETVRLLLTPDADFRPIPLPRPGDWLALHTEQGQTFENYRDANPNRPVAPRRIIYLLPIGEFSEEMGPLLQEIRRYAAAFFQLEVKLLPRYGPHDLEFSPRKNPRSGQRQILTTDVRTYLKSQLPPDAYCLLGITMADLYPAPSWNYVFGEASLDERVGIYSLARYDPVFWDEPRGKDYQELVLQRSCKVLAHETCHMFGMNHCIYFDCVVDGSNSLVETDAQSQHLCPICLRKLYHATGFDPVKRYRELGAFYRRHQWFEDYDWVERQLKRATRTAVPGDRQ